MHTILESIVYAFVQGIGEYLPISSSAHLSFISFDLFKKTPDALMLACLQLASLAGIIRFLWPEISALRKTHLQAESFRTWLYAAIAILPAAFTALLFSRHIKAALNQPEYAFFFLILSGSFLAFADQHRATHINQTTFSLRTALCIGCVQVCALVPGLSRFGLTVATAFLLGLGRAEAIRRSFQIGLLIMFAASAKEILDLRETIVTDFTTAHAVAFILTACISFILGTKILNWFSSNRLIGVAVYCIVLGLSQSIILVFASFV